MGVRFELCLLSLLATICGVFGGKYCGRGLFKSYCTFGCCGFYDDTCCDYNESVKPVGLIVGLTVLGIFVVSVIITVVCCCMRRRGSHGQVLSPATTTGTVVVANSTNQTVNAMGQPMPINPQLYQPGGFIPPPMYPVGNQPYPAQPYYPAAPQYGPPAGAAMGPPAYSQVVGGNDNQAFSAEPSK